MLSNLNNLSGNEIMKILIIINTILYNVIVLPKLKKSQLELFDNIFFRGIIILFIVSICFCEPLIALILSISYVLTHVRFHYLLKEDSEHFTNNKSNPLGGCSGHF